MTTALKPNPVVFIHGMWIHSSAWQPWLKLFESRGYAVSVRRLPARSTCGWPRRTSTATSPRVPWTC